MTKEPYSIRIFVPNGDPEGVRIIERFNRNGKAVVFSRGDYEEAKKRPEFSLAGVYLLTGYCEGDDDKSRLYIGHTADLPKRFAQHTTDPKMDFWDKACIFVMSDNMDRARTSWLEYELIKQADTMQRYIIDNVQRPNEPNLSEADKAETNVFLKEMLQVLPLIGIHAFEAIKRIEPEKAGIPKTSNKLESVKDLVVVPANEEGFQEVFINENCWYAIRIGGGMLDKLKWIAAYQTRPVSAITHIAEIDHIEPYGDSNKYKLVFASPAQKLEKPIELGDNPNLSPQAPRYGSHAKLIKARTLQNLFG